MGVDRPIGATVQIHGVHTGPQIAELLQQDPRSAGHGQALLHVGAEVAVHVRLESVELEPPFHRAVERGIVLVRIREQQLHVITAAVAEDADLRAA